MKNIFLAIAIGIFTVNASAQYAYKDGNRIGITAGVTQMSLISSEFNSKPELGWIAGMAVRGNYYDNFSMIFGMQFTESSFSLESTSLLLKKEDVKYTLSGVQVRLLLSYNVVKDHVSIDMGPILQVNGKLGIDDKKKDNTLLGTGLNANDIIDVTKINGNLYFGISAGGRIVRGIVCYQYGLNNIMNNLNKKEDLQAKNNDRSFNGHVGLLSAQLLVNL
jgi:hypothetical protein